MKKPSAPLVRLKILAISSVPLLGTAAVERTTSSAPISMGSPSVMSSVRIVRFLVFGSSKMCIALPRMKLIPSSRAL